MGVFTVSRGKAVYLYVKNKDANDYIRVTDKEGRLLKNYRALEKRAHKLDESSRPGTGTRYIYLICATNKAYGYERLVFRVQPPGCPSKTFRLDQHGYRDAFLNAKRYLTSFGFECGDVPNPARYRELITRVRGDTGYRSILKEYKDAIPESKTEETLRAALHRPRGRVRRA